MDKNYTDAKGFFEKAIELIDEDSYFHGEPIKEFLRRKIDECDQQL